MNYFVNCNADKELEIYFKNDNFKIIQDVNEVNLSEKNINIVYGSHETEILNNKLVTNILLLTRPIVNVKIIDSFNFIIPTSPLLFDINVKTLQFKLLLPININNNDNWNKYSSGDKFFRGYRSNIRYAKCEKETCSIFVYYNTDELCDVNFDNVKLLQVNPVINFTLYTLNNCLRFRDKTMKSLSSGVPEAVKCKIITVKNYDAMVNIKRGVHCLIVRDGFACGRNINISKITDNYNKRGFNCVSFHVSGKNDPEYAIFCNSSKNKTLSVNDLLSYVEYHDSRCIGCNTTELEDHHTYNMYQAYGKNNMYDFYDHFINIQSVYYDVLVNYVRKINIVKTQEINQHKFKRILAFWGGLNEYVMNIDDINKFIGECNYFFRQKKILLLSKNIISYGGNQKTAMQIYYELMVSGYDVKIGCLTRDELVDSIDRRDIIHFENISQAVQEANSGGYETIIINKLDEFVEIAHQVKPRCVFITHNSMDPVNARLIHYSKNFNKILTINHYHNSLMHDNAVNIPVSRYLNYDTDKKTQIKSRDKMKYIITFIGRLSDEKNLLLLLESLSQCNTKLKLNIIGDGKLDISPYQNNTHLNFVGRADYNQIMYYLANSDYLVSTSCTEGLPFVFLEAMSIGIPIISANIVGCNEIVTEGKTGLLFNFKNYNHNKNSMELTNDKWNIFDVMSRNKTENITNIVNALERAYNISIAEWTCMSNNCYQYYNDNFNPKLSMKNNVTNITNNNRVAIQCDDCDPLFVNMFKNIDIVKSVGANKTYDIILKLDSFDMFCGRLSLLRNNKFSGDYCKRMGKTLSRLYRLRKELLDGGIGTLTDGKNQIIIGNGSYLNVKEIHQYI